MQVLVTFSREPLTLIFPQDNYNEQIDMWSVGCIYAELLQMLAMSSETERERERER